MSQDDGIGKLWSEIGRRNVGRVAVVYLHPSSAPVRKTKAFKDRLRSTGLLDYWRVRGWPDVCHPVGADDFACD